MNYEKIIELQEFSKKTLLREDLPSELGETLWQKHKEKVDVEFPSPKTEGKWELTSLGYVGFIALSNKVAISLSPKISLENIFGMLEYAYDLKSFQFTEDIFGCSSIEEFYNRLVRILSNKVLSRIKQGLYGDYLPYTETLPYIRGRLDISSFSSKPWKVKPVCSYHEHTRNVEDNQILTWALKKIITTGISDNDTLNLARQAYRNLQRVVSTKPIRPEECIKRLYNRLNDDYKPMHLLCRFFLENIGPTHLIGEKHINAFIVNMAQLYERFVAQWLQKNLPQEYILKAHERVELPGENEVKLNIDLVLYNEKSQEPIAVLDTKYKVPQEFSRGDFNQITVYAVSKNCDNAFLIYPQKPEKLLNTKVNNIQVRNLTFKLDGDLEENGKAFLDDLLACIEKQN
ncbi:MAG: McrC family protein [Kosmotogaceae bacterium]